MQGGHNDKIAHQLYTTLSAAGRERLRWYWYVGKDQTRPIPAVYKKRSCHIKLMIVDEHVGIVGSGNQDTQSWFHSQEVNLMIDSPRICRAWIEALRRNQNTGLYGEVGHEDGIWRDEGGGLVEGATGIDAGRFPWVKGVVGAVKRLQGTGGF
jgi:phosphatidylserine/phosphatidylglycerophosphate/cardiolipin synthase-like enzyme